MPVNLKSLSVLIIVVVVVRLSLTETPAIEERGIDHHIFDKEISLLVKHSFWYSAKPNNKLI